MVRYVPVLYVACYLCLADVDVLGGLLSSEGRERREDLGDKRGVGEKLRRGEGGEAADGM